ncbi:MAG: tRNA (guanosine(46)-N7)-methyltransferase TrmB [Candidatus Peregrinibacteria bacterium]|nr:tRNA (guanosine(46)-N7)-methyltransferase TrmB [Candidatus Peregrinibacteria bacterium]
MPRKKLKHFAELKTFGNTFETPEEKAKISWGKYFGNKNPIVLELACGRGYYTIALGEKFPDKNFVGVDIKGHRIWSGAKKAFDAKMKNVAFIRHYIDELKSYFKKDEVDEIWITFPDPFPPAGKAKKRLTSPKFLEIYRKVLKPNGVIHLKTDNENLFKYSKKTMEGFCCANGKCGFKMEEVLSDVHSENPVPELLQITTHYESIFLKEGKKINYLRAISLVDKTCSSDKTLRKATKRTAKTTRKKPSKTSKGKS